MSAWIYLETDLDKLTGKTIQLTNTTNVIVEPTDTIYVYVRSTVMIGLHVVMYTNRTVRNTIISKKYARLDPPIPFNTMFNNCIDKAIPTQTNRRVFQMTYFKKETFCKLVDGSKLSKYIESLIGETIATQSSSEYVSDDIFVKKQPGINSDDNPLSELDEFEPIVSNPSDEIKPGSTITRNDELKKSMETCCDTDVENSDDIVDEESDDEDAVDQVYSDEEEYEDEEGGTIPILVIPCTELVNMEQRKRNKTLFSHITQCKECEVTNNNNGFVDGKGKIRYLKSAKHTDLYEKALTAYHRLQRIKPERPIDVIMIDTAGDIYENCFLVTSQI